MVRGFTAILLSLAAATPAGAASRCDATVTNGDDAGAATNVRAGPSSRSNVLLTLAKDAPVELHIVAGVGSWFRIDRIHNVEQDRPLFRGEAWIHRSQLALSVAGGDHRLYALPDRKAAVVMRLTPDGNRIDVIGCKGRWVKAIVDKQATGWMAPEAQCSNPMTTCS